ncbi:MAG: hypothetical protein U0575_12145 [Phycisphaerales bacterium]
MSVLDQLVNLHRVDSQVRGLRARLDTADEHLAAQEKLVATLERQRQELDTQWRHVQAKIANLEGEAKTLDARIEKLREAATNSTASKVSTALLTEVNHVKAERATIDSRQLAEMEQAEKIKAELARVAAAVADRQRIRDLAVKERAERAAEVGERLAELEVQRETAAAALPEVTLKLFNKVAALHAGDALAQIEEVDRRHREYACGACNMHLPFESVSRLTAPAGAVVQCGSCLRILYLQQDTRTALAKR